MSDDVSSHSVTASQLQAIIERIERLEAEKRDIADAIKEVYAESRATGFDIKAIRTLIMLRKKPEDDRREEEAILQLYMETLGMA